MPFRHKRVFRHCPYFPRYLYFGNPCQFLFYPILRRMAKYFVTDCLNKQKLPILTKMGYNWKIYKCFLEKIIIIPSFPIINDQGNVCWNMRHFGQKSRSKIFPDNQCQNNFANYRVFVNKWEPQVKQSCFKSVKSYQL